MTDHETNTKTAPETVPTDAPTRNREKPDTPHHNDLETIPQPTDKEREYGGRVGPNPTRYGDWESKGRCVDF